ncbi:HIT domain-containing protein [Herbidospora sp. NBRC 101105]|uniref:HIT domain-containing protein n=1 Tax=Herbidospora sp. NBRC 101105 TaxID=3032195 RepID=UPI0025568F74|nr:HIT domain-containing protein [Herbidospora sp. NBRC 101105]
MPPGHSGHHAGHGGGGNRGGTRVRAHQPAYPVHVVVVPKVHVSSLVDLGDGGEQLLGKVMAVVQQVAAQMEEEHGAACVTTNVGLYQESRHLHFHVYHRGESEAQILATYSHHDS